MKKWLKNAKGLTLVELLAVIVILGIIAAIAVPVISTTIQNSRERSDVASLRLVQDAATRWAIDHSVVTDRWGVALNTLVSDGYLQQIPAVQAGRGSGIVFTSFSIDVQTNGDYEVIILDGGNAAITDTRLAAPVPTAPAGT